MKLDIKIAESDSDISACMQLRWTVFVQEQNVAEHEDVDGQDDHSIHILATSDGIPVGAARLQHNETYAKIQRVCVPKDHRGLGIGAEIIRFMINYVSQRGDAQFIRLGAQMHALEFYRRLGFVEFGDQYLDAGIWHKDMELDIV
ncbi:GNAT family N-acetyltransferase [Parasulfitobacter algicola]|uniref:GNAT family N-acetyltransferase n=1 Tax=Parasulfitobacter algicola TaxID=2614809 RepID=A0ABX2IQJ2_9RHOB|nr:GNAT family N-acetyltransferase [Sulfitobacter algicola]NSX55152.1 GNAT family N-acetyltransferase [Sulfitobacter algicola]